MTNNIISFFSGAGGMDLGFERAGFKIKLAVELEQIMCETLRLNNKDTSLNILQGNILETSTDEILDRSSLKKGMVTGIIGGSPCQSFSTAGNRGAFSDDRGQAMIKYIELINEIKPEFFVLENVKGLLSAALEHVSLEDRKKNKEYGIPLKETQQPGSAFKYLLSKIRGYDVHYKVLNAAEYGVPQKRERIFIIGFIKDAQGIPMYDYVFPTPTHRKISNQNATLFDYENRESDLQPWVSFIEATSNLDTSKMNYQKYSEKRLEIMKKVPKGGGNWRDLKVFGEIFVREAMRGAYESGGGKVGFFRRIKANEPAPTLLTSPAQNSTNLGHPYEDRPLSIEEYLAIQQFPDGYNLFGNLSDQYKQIGNAVPVGLAYVVAKSILTTLENKKIEHSHV
ncbi:DNA cytosine methyltransferase [Planococcus sp. CP5-4]|uniref:DNA cytosine methyltransferase n=1 Tax=unclassified Planococcus (in: firmicutes) TaxID=2662419 RepID=UPI001C239717|nr:MULTISPECIES: DNA cytosine methyltransferase [unclassified Planococcus (in: firmicutes)]MBU9674965.1 DNA cytosine methyltransferase [Planococcus sp. CP5-4_YE]MBV0908428.1 DNA cytosine methyltransferase [Planococcus sp. CP5-4_UN]MBW6062642.1 DNA cytosine methyltransferase [Planococcus sp. CP5-4]